MPCPGGRLLTTDRGRDRRRSTAGMGGSTARRRLQIPSSPPTTRSQDIPTRPRSVATVSLARRSFVSVARSGAEGSAAVSHVDPFRPLSIDLTNPARAGERAEGLGDQRLLHVGVTYYVHVPTRHGYDTVLPRWLPNRVVALQNPAPSSQVVPVRRYHPSSRPVDRLGPESTSSPYR